LHQSLVTDAAADVDAVQLRLTFDNGAVLTILRTPTTRDGDQRTGETSSSFASSGTAGAQWT